MPKKNKIKFIDKIDKENSSIPEVNKITADNVNEIKKVVTSSLMETGFPFCTFLTVAFSSPSRSFLSSSLYSAKPAARNAKARKKP